MMVRPEQTSTIPGTEPTAASRDGGAWSVTRLAGGWSDVTDGVTAEKPDVTGLDTGLSALRNVGVTLLSNVHESGESSNSNSSVVTSYFTAASSAAAANNGSVSTHIKDANVSWLYLENVTRSVGNFSNGTEELYDLKHPALGVFLALFSFVVIVGNIMVIVAVFKELYLRSVTNYFIVVVGHRRCHGGRCCHAVCHLSRDDERGVVVRTGMVRSLAFPGRAGLHGVYSQLVCHQPGSLLGHHRPPSTTRAGCPTPRSACSSRWCGCVPRASLSPPSLGGRRSRRRISPPTSVSSPRTAATSSSPLLSPSTSRRLS